MVNTIIENTLLDTATTHEKELINILHDSSLYGDMHPEEKEKLLNYLISSYFN